MERNIQLEQALVEFPEYRDRLLNLEDIQLLEGRRLLSAEDKIERFGGLEVLRQNFLTGRNEARPSKLILQACRDGLIVPMEIIKFVEAILESRKLDPSALHYAIYYINRHSEAESIRTVPDVTYLMHRKYNNSYDVLARTGYETTQEGLRTLADNFKEGSGLLPRSASLWRPRQA